MKRKLRLFNGRIVLNGKAHGFIAAYSVADAARVLDETVGGRGSLNDINVYWSHDCWGDSMVGITPKRGLWVLEDRASKPKPFATYKLGKAAR